MLKEQIQEFSSTGKLPKHLMMSDIKAKVDEYPYFQTLVYLYLKALYVSGDETFPHELKRLSAFIADRKAFFYTIFSEEFAQFFERTGRKELSEDRTSVLLNAFFEAMDVGTTSDDTLPEEALEAGIVSVDYFSFLEKEEAKSADSQLGNSVVHTEFRHQGIIDDFIERTESGEAITIDLTDKGDATPPPSVAATTEAMEDSVFFTETLSRIYIKQKKYKEAHKIIKQLSLNYPEKNTYFADQIRFLEKLMQNAEASKRDK